MRPVSYRHGGEMRPEIARILASVEKPYRYIGGEVGARRKAWDSAAVRLCLAFPDTYEMGMSNTGLAILYNIVNDGSGMLAERAFAPWPDMEAKLIQNDISLFSLESQRPIKDFDVLGIGLPYELSYTNILTILSLSGIPWRARDRDDSYPLVIAGGPCAFNPEPVADFFDAIVIGDGESALLEILELVKDKKFSCNVIARSPSTHIPFTLSLSKGERGSLRTGSATKQFQKYHEIATAPVPKGPREAESQRDAAGPRNDFFRRIAEIEGVYVPSLEKPQSIKKAFVEDIECSPYPSKPVVAYAAVHDRAGIEVARGCTRGCRFCQAGFIYRPTRIRSPETAAQLALTQLQNGGHEDISFLSLSLGDYPCLNELLRSVNDSWEGAPINPQFPSLRVESLSDETLSLLGKARHGSFTLAPEAATERMRAAINKGNTDEDLYASVEKVFAAGWHQIKLYFMIGLPGETQEELDGIVEIANRCLSIGKKYHHRAEVTVSTSTFVPKSHTPFQWVAQISIEETAQKQAYLKKNLRRHGLFYRWHNAHMSFLEGAFSRGDRKLSSVIEHAHKFGARFDAWDDKFNFSIWEKAFAEAHINPHEYLRQREQNEKFPWDHLYTELKKDFLWQEYERSLSGVSTPDCTREKCQGCGVCNGNRLSGQVDQGGAGGCRSPTLSESVSSASRCPTIFREAEVSDSLKPSDTFLKDSRTPASKYRLQLAKTGSAAFLGHTEFANVIRRALRRAGLPLRYSEGFHPHSRISFGKALPVGIESDCEFCDVELTSRLDPKEIMGRLASVFSEGVNTVSVDEISQAGSSIERSIASTKYRIEGVGKRRTSDAVKQFEAANDVPFVRRRGEKTANVDLKDFIAELVVDGDNMIGLTLHERDPMIRVSEALQGIFGLSGEEIINLRIRKIKCQMNLL